jgi:hypothetical protein
VLSVLAYETVAVSHLGEKSASAAIVVTPGDPAPSAQGAAATTPSSEVHIANNGLVLLRGAQVRSIIGNVMRVELVWQSGSIAWTVSTAYSTQFYSATGEKQTLADIQVGDVISVTGALSGSGGLNAVAATYVRE